MTVEHTDRADRWRAPEAAAPVRARVTVPTSSTSAVAAAFGAAGLVTGGTVLIRNWPGHAAAEWVAAAYADMDGYVLSSAAGLTVTGRSTSGVLAPITRKAAPLPRSVSPTVLALACLANGESWLSAVGIPTALVDNLRRLGADLEEVGEALTVRPAALHGGEWMAVGPQSLPGSDSVAVALAGLVLGLVVSGIDLVGWSAVEARHRGLTGEWLRMLAAEEYLVPGSDLLPQDYSSR